MPPLAQTHFPPPRPLLPASPLPTGLCCQTRSPQTLWTGYMESNMPPTLRYSLMAHTSVRTWSLAISVMRCGCRHYGPTPRSPLPSTTYAPPPHCRHPAGAGTATIQVTSLTAARSSRQERRQCGLGPALGLVPTAVSPGRSRQEGTPPRPRACVNNGTGSEYCQMDGEMPNALAHPRGAPCPHASYPHRAPHINGRQQIGQRVGVAAQEPVEEGSGEQPRARTDEELWTTAIWFGDKCLTRRGVDGMEKWGVEVNIPLWLSGQGIGLMHS